MKLRLAGIFALFGILSCAPANDGASKDPTPGDADEESGEPSSTKDDQGGKSGAADSSSKSDDSKKKPLDCSTLKSTGLKVGDVAPNLVLADGEGRKVRLHDYCNDSVILIASEY